MGSLVTALASYVDALQHRGRWLVRVEDVDLTRRVEGIAEQQLNDLRRLGFDFDPDVMFQSQRYEQYEAAIKKLEARNMTYPCFCSRQEIMARIAQLGQVVPRGDDVVYPGTCRDIGSETDTRRLSRAPAIRIRVDESAEDFASFTDRFQGKQNFNIAAKVGDFVLRRADGIVSYQLAVVVDDAAQGITHVVRGGDLLNNTPRQRWLNYLLGFRQPEYAHVPLVLGGDGQKLSKQNGAKPITAEDPLSCLLTAARHLGWGEFASLAKARSVAEFWNAVRDDLVLPIESEKS